MNKIDRSIAPVMFTPNNVEALTEKVIVTPKGVKIYSLEFPQFDVVRVSMVFRAGSKYQNMPFMAASTLGMLSEGTANKTNKQISDILDFYGIYFDVSIDRDYSIVTICSLSKFFDTAIDILEDIILNPTFPKKELSVLGSKRKNSLKLEREKVDYIALEKFSNSIYGENNPYGVSYSEECYEDLKPKHLKEFYDNHYLLNNLFSVVSGNITPEIIEKISNICDKLPEKEFAIKDCSKFDTEPVTRHIEKEDSLQSAIKVGRLMFTKKHEDFIPMQFLTTVLGGYFGSRLILNVREDKGYTYSIFAGLINMEDGGHFVISTEVGSEYTQKALEEIFYEMEVLKTELIPEEELVMVRNVIIGQILRILDGPFGISDVTIESVQNQTDNSSVGQLIRTINEIGAEQLRDMAIKYFNKEEMTVVVVGAK